MQPQPSIPAILLAFLRIGTGAFGGGLAALPVFEAELSRAHHWLPPSDVAECFAIAQSIPGVIIVNFAVLTGRQLRGAIGAIAATIAVVTPAFLVILLLAALLGNHWNNPWIQGALTGLRPAVIAMLAAAAFRLGRMALSHFTPLLFFLAALALALLRFPLLLIILLAAAAGIIRGLFTATHRKNPR